MSTTTQGKLVICRIHKLCSHKFFCASKSEKKKTETSECYAEGMAVFTM